MPRQYADDGLMIDDETEAEDLQEFVERRTRNPFVMDGTMVWNFSSHRTDPDALESAVEQKLEGESYIIPFQVTGVWGYMTHIIPDSIARNAQVLVYIEGDEEYVEYENLVTDMDGDEIDEFKTELENDLSAFTSR